MNVEKNQISEPTDNKCKSCKVFYAAETFEGFCSACFKKQHGDKKEELHMKQITAMTQKTLSVDQDDQMKEEEVIAQPSQKDKKRCFNCSKKLGLLGIQCKCGFIFCNMHRLPENHKCNFDYREAGKKKLEKQIIKVYNGKISEI